MVQVSKVIGLYTRFYLRTHITYVCIYDLLFLTVCINVCISMMCGYTLSAYEEAESFCFMKRFGEFSHCQRGGRRRRILIKDVKSNQIPRRLWFTINGVYSWYGDNTMHLSSKHILIYLCIAELATQYVCMLFNIDAIHNRWLWR